jgi:hypothetical protein
MAGPLEIAARVEELIAGIDPAAPTIDRELVEDRLATYVRALGIETVTRVRWVPDLHVLLRERRRRRDDWRSFTARHARLVQHRPFWRDEAASPAPQAAQLARLDALVAAAALGSRTAYRVCQVAPGLIGLVEALAVFGELVVPKRITALPPLAEAAAAGLYALGPLDQGVLACVPRPLLRLDEEGRLHDWDGRPAADWEGGSGLWYWHGVRMTEQQGSNPDLVTPRRIASWANAERRRVAIERIGLEAFLCGLEAELIQQDDYGRVWRTREEIGGEPYVAVEVTNATAEADGSYRRYFLRVPPRMRSARSAVAWSFGMSAREYSLAVES